MEKLDAGDFAAAALAAWQAQEIGFDCIYTGYLCSPGQAQMARQMMERSPSALKVTDPAMADGGKLYRGVTEEMAGAMAELCTAADLITPNITEAVLLAGWEYKDRYSVEELEQLCGLLADRYRAQVIITGAPAEDGRMLCIGRGAAAWEHFTLTCSYVDAVYPGTGDLFCAVTTGALLRGNALQSAAELALRFVENAARVTYAAGEDPRFGLTFEPLLCELVPQKEDLQWVR